MLYRKILTDSRSFSDMAFQMVVERGEVMVCPECGYNTYIIDTRIRPDETIRRRRQCVECKYRFTTVEVPMDKYEKKRYQQASYEYCFLNEEYTNQNCKKCPYRKRCLNE